MPSKSIARKRFTQERPFTAQFRMRALVVASFSSLKVEAFADFVLAYDNKMEV
jgi:hypothetical protein